MLCTDSITFVNIYTAVLCGINLKTRLRDFYICNFAALEDVKIPRLNKFCKKVY